MYTRSVACTVLLLCATIGSHAQAPEPAAPPAPQSAPPDTSAIAEKVRDALRAEGGAGPPIVVSTHADTIVLTGEVQGEVEAARALAVAQDAAGGLRVSGQLEVRAGGSDEAVRRSQLLVKDVENALRQDGRTANLGVAVSVDEQQMIGLHGMVPSRESRQAVENVAARVAGATRIRSHLLVPGE